MSDGPRTRIIESAAQLLRERGLARTGLREVVAHASAPWGSLTHYFPGGKEQIATEAAEWVGAQVQAFLDETVASTDPVTAVRRFAEVWTQVVKDSDGRAGCTIAAVVADADDDALRIVAERIFAGWRQPFVASLLARGVHPRRAHQLGTMIIGGLEGALVLARSERSTEPLIEITQELEYLVSSALR